MKPKPRLAPAAGALLVAVLCDARLAAPQTPRLVFNGLAPCRLVDTRQSAAGALAAGEVRTFHVVGAAADFPSQGGRAGGCGIPGFAGPAAPQTQAVAFNFVAVNPAGAGNLRAWPSDQPVPNASILNYASGLNLANGIAVPVRQDSEGGDLSVRADVSGTHLVIDVVGYYRYLTQLDGTGSGVDADLLDGLDSAAFAAAAHSHDGQYWKLDGNAGTTPGTHFLGTSDTQPLELKVNGARALRLEPGTFAPNVLGGFSGNTILGAVSAGTIAGGGHSGGAGPNQVVGNHGTVGGGSGNRAGLQATVAGGIRNIAGGFDAAVGGGQGNVATGNGAAIPGGYSNTATGLGSFAAGRRAKSFHDGAFVWGDFTDADVASTAPHQFIVRASGGVWLGAGSAVSIGPGRFIDTSTGAHLTDGGAWTNSSDVRLKDDFAPVDGAAVLEALAGLPLTSWRYKAEGQGIRHLGPTAQDFRAAFGLGADDRSITTVDAAGVALAAIQELERRTRQVETLAREIQELRRLIERPAPGR